MSGAVSRGGSQFMPPEPRQEQILPVRIRLALTRFRRDQFDVALRPGQVTEMRGVSFGLLVPACTDRGVPVEPVIGREGYRDHRRRLVGPPPAAFLTPPPAHPTY